MAGPCSNCGEPTTYESGGTQYLCPRCWERYKASAEAGKPSAEDLAARAETVSDRLWACGVGRRQLDASLDDFRADTPSRMAALEAARAFVAAPRGFLVLLGPPGRGKSFLAVGILRAVFLAGGTGTMAYLPDLLERFRRTGLDDPDPVDEYTRGGLLVLDDLGTERPTDYAREAVGRLVDKRWRDELPTVVTSNLTMQQIAELDARIADRLAEDGRVFQLDGPSLRLEHGAQVRDARPRD